MELHFLDYIHRTSGARMTELDLRVFHWWGRYCLHLTFNACLRTIGPRYRIRTGPICLEGRDASRWHQSRIDDLRFLSHLCINIISRFSRKIKFLHSKTYKLELWFEVTARKAHFSFLCPRSKIFKSVVIVPLSTTYRVLLPKQRVPRQAGVILEPKCANTLVLGEWSVGASLVPHFPASWCLRTGSNCRLTGYEPDPLPTEVLRHKTNFSFLLLLVAEVCIFYEGWPLHRVRRHRHQ